MAGFGSLLGGLAGGAIGSAVVRLTLDSTAYQAQLKAAQGQTVASANTMGAGFAKFGAVAKTGLLLGGAALVAFGASAVRAFTEAQQVMAGTDAVLKSTGGQAGVTAAEIGKMSDSLADLAGADDEAVQSSINLLLTFRQIADEEGAANTFERTEQAILDMATAMNHGAIPTMETLKQTTIQVGKAVNDPIKGLTALARVGVQFSEEQTTLIKKLVESGDLLGAQGVILEELEAQFGGAAEAAGNTFAGAMGDVGREFGNFQEKVGEFLIPLLESILPVVNELLGPLGDLADLLSRIVVPMGELSIIPVDTHRMEEYRILVQAIGEAFVSGSISEAEFTRRLQELDAQGIIPGNITTKQFALSLAGVDTELNELASTVPSVVEAHEQFVGSVDDMIASLKEAGQRARNFAGLTTKEIGELRENAIADFDQMAGGLTTLSRKWELTSEAAVRATRIIADRQQDIARALGKLDDLNIGEGLKKKLLELGPDMVIAFTTGNRNQRQKIRENLKDYDLAMEDTSDEVQDIAHKGGVQVGADFVSGAVQGILDNADELETAAANAIYAAIRAAKNAAEESSHSRVGRRIGEDFILGIVDGLESEDEALIAAATHAIDQIRKALEKELAELTREFEKQISKLEGQLSRVQSQASSLRGAVTGGFSSFADISGAFELPGADIGGFFQSQVSGAQQFASVLNALQAQGASAGLLSQIASGGPEAIPFAQSLLQQGPGAIAGVNAALQTIADLAGSTGKGISEAFFGERIDDLRDRLKDVHSEQREQTRMFELMLRLLDNPERLLRRLEEIRDVIGNITVEVDGQALGNSVHSELIRRGRRNGSLQLT